jgi:hypothetical protein
MRLRRVMLEHFLVFPFHYELEANDNGWPDWWIIRRELGRIIDLKP